jgi:hypothetical protein
MAQNLLNNRLLGLISAGGAEKKASPILGAKMNLY